MNTWRETFNIGQELFGGKRRHRASGDASRSFPIIFLRLAPSEYDKRYNPGSIPYMPTYPDRTTLSGQFIDNGPLASNDFL